MPAMLSRNRIRLDGKSEILVYAAVTPPHTLAVRIGTRISMDPFDPPHPNHAFLDFLPNNFRACGFVDAVFVMKPPAPQMMRTRDHSGSDRLGYPNPIDVMSYSRFDFQKIRRL